MNFDDLESRAAEVESLRARISDLEADIKMHKRARAHLVELAGKKARRAEKAEDRAEVNHKANVTLVKERDEALARVSDLEKALEPIARYFRRGAPQKDVNGITVYDIRVGSAVVERIGKVLPLASERENLHDV